MKKNNKIQSKNINRPFDAEIKQMRKNKVILITGFKVKPFTEECEKRGIDLQKGHAYNNGIIFYEK